jgi:hypothetical protein
VRGPEPGVHRDQAGEGIEIGLQASVLPALGDGEGPGHGPWLLNLRAASLPPPLQTVANMLRRGTWKLIDEKPEIKFMPQIHLASGPAKIRFMEEPLPSSS